LLEILNRDQLYQIHLASLQVLENVGVKVEKDEALKVLADAGAKVDWKTKNARIPNYLVKEEIQKAPSAFTLFGRDRIHKNTFGDGRVHFSMQGEGVHVLDLETGERRGSTIRDAAAFYKLADALENIDHASMCVSALDVPDASGPAHEVVEGFKNTTKTIDGYEYGESKSLDTIRIASVVAGGEEELRKNPLLLGFYNPVSPLQHSKDLLEGLRIYAEHNQPTLIAPMDLAGGTGPVTLAGLLVQQNAEVLSGIVIAELFNPGAPILYGTVSTVMDMRTGGAAFGAVELGLMNIASAQLARYYNLPSRGTGGATESKIPDIQAGFEKAMILSMAALAGISFIYDAAGSLESSLTASFEQAVIDNEICGMVSRAVRGIDVSDRTLATDVIEAVGPGGEFLSQRHTLENLRGEHYIPSIISRDKWEVWKKAGSKDLREVARQEAKRILEKHQPEPLDHDIRIQIENIVKEIDKNAS
jgi:trimethylamine--corrinoid protein Co-methyltransferase